MPYKKRIFDIIPPGEKKIEKKREEQFLAGLAEPSVKTPRKLLRIFVCFLAILIAISAFCYFLIEPTAIVKVWPKTKKLEMETILTAAIQRNRPNFSQKVIPAISLELEKTISQEFSASVTTTRERARGIIRVYNKYYEPVTLIKDTRFLPSDSDTEFLSQRKITIPAGGFTDVEVIAAAPGEEYNIQPCAFVIPNLRKFSPPRLYYDITGRSFAPMTGGRIAEIPKVTALDLETAKTAITKRVFEETKLALEEKIPEDTIILEETIEQEILEVTPLAKVGQEIENFIVQIKSKSKALGIKKADLDNFAKDYIISQIPSDQTLYLESLNTNFNTKTASLEEGTAELGVTISGLIYSRLDEGFIKEIIIGKDPVRARQDILVNLPGISKVQIEIKPFWQTKIPQESKDIEIKINF